MLLNKLQSELEAIYEIQLQYRVNDFVIDDPQLVAELDCSPNPREIPEKLLIHQDGDNIDIALYLDSELVKRLNLNDPTERLHNGNIYDFWTALEGISHFLYFAWNAEYERKVSLLELELQAEVDKFILATLLLEKQFNGYGSNGYSSQGLHHHLFVKASFDERLNEEEFVRYRDANYFAGKFCSHIKNRFLNHGAYEQLMNELRRFYRLNHQHKLNAIGSLC